MRASESQIKYGVIGGGALSKSLIGKLPRKARQIGPVVSVSYRNASRITNVMRAGHPALVEELDGIPIILLHAQADQMRAIAVLLEDAKIRWKGKCLIFCDCDAPVAIVHSFRALGASTAVARQFGIAGKIMLEGQPAALACAHRLAAELRLRPIEIAMGAGYLFAAVQTLSTAVTTPLVDRAADMLRAAGLGDKDAVKTATAMFEQSIQEYSHSGKQSWAWYKGEPDVDGIEAEIGTVAEDFRDLFRELILSSFDHFDKHPEIALKLKATRLSALAAAGTGRP